MPTALFRPAIRSMLSFWEKESFLNYDLIVIGSGIVGLSTALSYRQLRPTDRILVLERGLFPTGASTKNAGFACYGSAAELWHDIQVIGETKALEVLEMRKKGMEKLRKRLGDDAIGYEAHGGGEIFRPGDAFDPEIVPYLNRLLLPIFGTPVFEIDRLGAEKLGFQAHAISHFVWNKVEGQIHTGNMMRNLLRLARGNQIEILTGAKAQKPEKCGRSWQIAVESSPAIFQSERLALCTNAFTPELFPELDVNPGRGQVLITKPIANLRFKGIFHFDEGYYYFRNVGNRVLFGGGRNLDFEGETTSEIALNPNIQASLEYHLASWILPKGSAFEVEDRWAGIMAFGQEKVPILRKLDEGLVAGVRMNGMGIAMGTEVGERLATLLLD